MGAAPPPPPTPLPGWLGPIVQITTQVGVPTVFAGVLLYFVLFRVTGVLEHIEETENERTQILSAMQDTLVATLERQTMTFEKSIKENIETNKLIWQSLNYQNSAAQRAMLPPLPGQQTPRAEDQQR